MARHPRLLARNKALVSSNMNFLMNHLTKKYGTINHTHTLYFMYNEYISYVKSINMIQCLVRYNDFDVFIVLYVNKFIFFM